MSGAPGRRVRRAVIGVAAAVCVCVGAAVPASGQAVRRRIYVTVLDGSGRAVAGLTAADFAVTSGAAKLEILSAGPATEPPSILILTDRLGLSPTYTAFDVRTVLGDFVKAVRAADGGAKFALTTFDGTVVQEATFANAAAVFDRSIGRLSAMGPDSVLLDGLADACRSMRAAPTDRRIVFVVLAAYRQDSSTLERPWEMLRDSGASLWAIEARLAGGGNYSSPIRENLLDDGSRLSGGYRATTASLSGLRSAAKTMAQQMAAQYAVTYSLPAGPLPGTVTVSVNRPGLKVLAPQWIAR